MTNASPPVRTSAPVRLDFAGAWTDVAPFATSERGVVVNAAIDLRTHVELHLDQPRYELWARDLDQRATAEHADQFRRDGHLDLLKAAIRSAKPGPCALHTSAEAPPGSGLGTSGALGVALVHAMDHATGAARARAGHRRGRMDRSKRSTPRSPAASRTSLPPRWADSSTWYSTSGRTTATSLAVDQEFAAELARQTLLCYTGRSRFSGDVITRVMEAYSRGDARVAGALRALADIGDAMADALRAR